jgi:SAM-dependent methyltransferase
VQLDADSLERIVPDELRPGDTTGKEALRLGIQRYEFAARVVRPGRLLDIACGVGYGTRLLSDHGAEIDALGVDLSGAAIAYANERYANERTHFLVSDAMSFHDVDGFDNIVSIETIEHLPEPAGFIEHLLPMLRPGGILVGSVPTTPSVDANPHHLHDFTERSFRRLFARHGLVEIDALRQDQAFELRSVLTRSEARMKQVRPSLPAYYLAHPGALIRRGLATLRYGFKNKYLTVAWRSPL